MFKLTEKDKKMLLILLIFLIGFGFYHAYQSMSLKLSNLKEENTKLLDRKAELDRAVEVYNKNKDKIEETKLNYYEISQKLPNNLDEKFCVVDALNLLRKYGAVINDLPIAQKQQFQYNGQKKVDGAYFHSIKITTQLTYENLKRLFTETSDFNTLYSVDSLSLVPLNNGDIISASFELKFFGFEDNNAPVRQWQDFNLETGKDKIFSSSTLKTTIVDTTSKEYIEQNKDFLVMLSTLNSPETAVQIVKIGEDFKIYGKNKQIEKAYIELKQNGEKLLYRMSTEGDAHPKDGGFKEFKINSENIIIYVYSTERKYQDDKNVILLNVKNETSKKVMVYVFNDDKNKPRLNLTAIGNNIFVEKR
ncbi:hypothetical protein [Thermobrachium celere]|uniref:Type IV pilus assembly protein PilO n=1 Tax=Thermobrachium celere DSM 8682 TaxID=941824 RepID=R7RQQ2_9CLOT|nr:hypothetical protein [Thermobrachium celere]CDF57618.1 hypothetical protein TCEL_01532 [Thermobrachium celere DSM 8682]